MNFTHYDMGQLSSGQVVEVTLSGSAANVRLMDSSNFSSFKAGRQHRYIGGLVKRSPYRMQVPSSGRWHVTVDMIGLRGTVRSSARVLPGALPAARSLSLASVPSLVQRDEPPGVDSVKTSSRLPKASSSAWRPNKRSAWPYRLSTYRSFLTWLDAARSWLDINAQTAAQYRGNRCSSSTSKAPRSEPGTRGSVSRQSTGRSQ